MTTRGRARLQAIAAMAALAVTGCGTAGNTGSPAQQPRSQQAPAAATPANPVPILRATGAHVSPGVRLGDHDVFGDRMAAGTMARFEQITVFTARSSSALRVMLARQAFTPDDYNGVVVIPAERAAILVSGWQNLSTGAPGWAKGGKPEQIARKVGGQLITSP